MFGSIFQQNSCYNSIINTFWLKCRTLNSNAPYFNWYIYTHMYIYMYVYKACYMHTLLYINRKLAGNLCAFVLPSASFYPYYKSNSIPEAVLLLLLVLLRCFVCGFFLLENKFIFNIFFFYLFTIVSTILWSPRTAMLSFSVCYFVHANISFGLTPTSAWVPEGGGCG